MPIRLDAALVPPQLQNTRLDMPQMSPEAAMAPGRALGELAQGIAAIAKPFAQHAENIQRMEDTRLMTEKQNAFDEGHAAHLREVASITDPVARLKATTDWLAANQPDTSDLSPVAASQFGSWYSHAVSQAHIEAGADAARTSRAGMARGLDTRLQQAVARGDAAGTKAILHQGEEAGFLTPSEAAARDKAARQHFKLQQEIANIDDDPFGSVQKYASEKAPEGSDSPLLYQMLYRHTWRRVIEEASRHADTIFDGIDGYQITKPSQIEGIAPRMDKASLDVLKNHLAMAGEPGAAERLASPAYQDETAGRIARTLADHPPGRIMDAPGYLGARLAAPHAGGLPPEEAARGPAGIGGRRTNRHA